MSVFDETLEVVEAIHTVAPPQENELIVLDPDALLPCVDSIGKELPLRQFKATSKVELFRAYSECQEELQEMYAEAAQLLGKVVMCNTQWISPQKSRPLNAAAIQKALCSNQQVEAIEFASGSQASAEIAAMPIRDIATQLVNSVRNQCIALLGSLNKQLAYMAAVEQVGSIAVSYTHLTLPTE